MDLVACLLPAGPPLHLETWSVDETTTQLTFRLTSTQALVHCPVCRFPTQRIHSHYTRTVADLPWAHLRVVVQLGVRKFFCANGRCTRRIFTERLPQLVAPWARRTQRLAAPPRGDCRRAGRRRGRAAQPAPRHAHQSQHAAAPAPPAAAARSRHPHRAGRGRFCPAETPDLWHDPG